MKNPKDRIREIENRLEQLPKGTLTYKTINGKKQPFRLARSWIRQILQESHIAQQRNRL